MRLNKMYDPFAKDYNKIIFRDFINFCMSHKANIKRIKNKIKNNRRKIK